jgi:hypothetical protein
MTVGRTGRKSGALSGLQELLTFVGDERRFTFQHQDELVFVGMPVAQRRSRARRKLGHVDAELREAEGGRKRSLGATPYHGVVRRGISRRRSCFDGRGIEGWQARHVISLSTRG